LAAFKAARARGETPAPVFLRVSGSDTPPRSPCLGVLQAEIAALVDPTLLWELCFYYDERDGIAQKFVRYTVFTENEILPRLKEDPRVFYTEDRKRLVPAFDSHMDRLQEWRRDQTTIQSGRAVSMTGCVSQRARDRPADPLSEERSTSATRNRPRWRPSRLCDAVTASDGPDCRHDAVEAQSSVTTNAVV
jgi:hypothetical protein